MHTYKPANSILDGRITDLLSVLCILTDLLRAHAKWGGGGSCNGFKFGTFIGHFLGDSMASMAVKGLMS